MPRESRVESPAKDEELADGLLDGILDDGDSDEDSENADSEEDVDSDDIEGLSDEEEDDEEDIPSDEVPSDGEEGVREQMSKLRMARPAHHGTDGEDGLEEEDEGRNYTVTRDANGGERYVYKEIEPDYDSDESATEATNTIGNISLSYYDAYPHIGYDINGKKIMRPAKGEALDALLDSIDVPKGKRTADVVKVGKLINTQVGLVSQTQLPASRCN